MLRRRRTHRFKRNVLFSSSKRRRVMLRHVHKKILRRGGLFAMQHMEETASTDSPEGAHS